MRRKSQEVKPFELPKEQYVRVHNSLVDIIMPSIPANAYKVLILIVRETFGRYEESRQGYRKVTRGVSYTAIRKRTGISSFTTISIALKILTSSKCIIASGGSSISAKSYRVNPDLKLSTVEEFSQRVAKIEGRIRCEKPKAIPIRKKKELDDFVEGVA